MRRYVTTLIALQSLDGDELIDCCYFTLLDRLPDDVERKESRQLLVKCPSGMTVLVKLSNTFKGCVNLARISGLQAALKRYKRSQLPVIGLFFWVYYRFVRSKSQTVTDGMLVSLTPGGYNILLRLEAEAARYRELGS